MKNRIRILLPFLLGLNIGVLAPPAAPAPQGPTLHSYIAEFTVDYPEGASSGTPGSFIFRATVPVPPGTFIDLPNTRTNFYVHIDSSGQSPIPAQVERVSSYPDGLNGCDVIEVLAEVTPDSSWIPGERKHFFLSRQDDNALYARPNTTTQTPTQILGHTQNIPTSIDTLLADSKSIVVVTVDGNGNFFISYPLEGLPAADPIYTANPSYSNGVEVQRYGKYVTSLRTYGIQKPLFPGTLDSDEYPHMFGVHSFISTFSNEEAMTLDLLINNGFSDLERTNAWTEDDSLGNALFTGIWVLIQTPVGAAPAYTIQQRNEDPYSHHAAPAGMPYVQNFPLGGKTYDVFHLVAPTSLIESPAAGLHVLGSTAQILRRLVISPRNSQGVMDDARDVLDARGMGFCSSDTDPAQLPPIPGGHDLYAWTKATTSRYFPQNTLLPKLDFQNASYAGILGSGGLRDTLEGWYSSLNGYVAAPSPTKPAGPVDVEFPGVSMGWARPLGNPNYGATGGNGIAFISGVRTIASQSREGYLWLALQHRLQNDRQSRFVYRADGAPISQEDYAVAYTAPAVVPKYLAKRNSFYGNASTTDFVEDLLPGNLGLPYGGYTQSANQYWQTLKTYGAHDLAHLCRYTSPLMAVAWISNDPLAKQKLEDTAEVCRMSLTNLAGNSYAPNSSYSWDRDLFRLWLHSQGTHKNYGLPDPAGRTLGWASQVLAGGFALGDADFRARSFDWFTTLSLVMADGAITDTDSLGRTIASFEAKNQNTKFFCPEPASPLEGPPQVRKTFEEMILDFGLGSVLGSVLPTSDPAHSQLSAPLGHSLNSFVSPYSWNLGTTADPVRLPWPLIAISTHDVHLGGDAYYSPIPIPNFENFLPPGPAPVGWEPAIDQCGTSPTAVFHYSMYSLADAFEHTADPQITASILDMLKARFNSLTPSIMALMEENLNPTAGPTAAEYWQWSNGMKLLGMAQNGQL